MTDDEGAVDKMKEALEKIRSCLPKDPNQSTFPWTANQLKKIIDEALGCPCGDFDEKPYTAGLPGNAAVIDNRLGCAYTGIEERSVNAVCSWMNEAHAAGRKAERERCADICEQNATCEGIAQKIKAHILGGQDGK